ncbi:hypothetical protein Pla22_41560 [Rubripirellula amarantea]|uniref:Uncharacterized protein n=1 Tax=Rubripirellula amarantea TaxID=2527999 RepID=A0A5C5WKW4_9BACT|nr:hypothetical protein [Rubripirellula amarantea]TWT51378.1 hypothetical protein Pla22_41560 [Rubripirellula amarantea]
MKMQSITVGLQQKIGQPNFGSIGASCVVEVTLDDREMDDATVIEQRIRQAFARCRRSIDDQLSSQVAVKSNRTNSPSPVRPSGSKSKACRPATEKQIRAIKTIALKHGIALASELRSRFQVESPERLSIVEASSLIDTLKKTSIAN